MLTIDTTRHDATQHLAEVVERLQVGLVEGVPDDLNVHLVQVLLVDAGLEERGEGGVHLGGGGGGGAGGGGGIGG